MHAHFSSAVLLLAAVASATFGPISSVSAAPHSEYGNSYGQGHGGNMNYQGHGGNMNYQGHGGNMNYQGQSHGGNMNYHVPVHGYGGSAYLQRRSLKDGAAFEGSVSLERRNYGYDNSYGQGHGGNMNYQGHGSNMNYQGHGGNMNYQGQGFGGNMNYHVPAHGYGGSAYLQRRSLKDGAASEGSVSLERRNYGYDNSYGPVHHAPIHYDSPVHYGGGGPMYGGGPMHYSGSNYGGSRYLARRSNSEV